MNVGDVLDRLNCHISEPHHRVNMGALFALNELYEQHCPQCINGGGPDRNGWAGNEIPGDAIQNILASLRAALDAVEHVRKAKPSGPRGLVRGATR